MIFFFCCLLAYSSEKLPSDLEWITNNEDPVWSSPDAVKGGTYYDWLMSFPLTFREYGPDSNSGVASIHGSLDYSLLALHPNTKRRIPSLATHWAFSKDQRTMYFKLDPDVTWSDGVKVTADDYLFDFEMNRSPHIMSPWYNEYYTKQLEKIVKYDDYTISVTAKEKKPRDELVGMVARGPKPRHFYKLDKDYVKKYNWKFPPVTGPYTMGKVRKGKGFTLVRVKNWWGENKRYLKNRFNVDKIKYTVIRNIDVAFQHFLKGKLSSFGLTHPKFWHEKSKTPEFEKGYIHKLMFYNDTPQPMWGIFINNDHPILKDLAVREGIQFKIHSTLIF